MFPWSDTLLGLEPLAEHLAARGWKVTLVDSPPRRGLFDLVDAPPRVLRVTGKPVSEVRVRLGGAMWGLGAAGGRSRLSVGGVPLAASQSMPVQLHWLVPVDPTGRPEDFEATLDVERGGFLWTGDVRAARWEGGRLAQALDADTALSTARALRLSERLFVKPDIDERCVRIIHQAKVVVRFSLFSSDVFSAERRLPDAALLDGVLAVAKAVKALGRRRVAGTTRRRATRPGTERGNGQRPARR